jgi:hypothetical protein
MARIAYNSQGEVLFFVFKVPLVIRHFFEVDALGCHSLSFGHKKWPSLRFAVIYGHLW